MKKIVSTHAVLFNGEKVLLARRSKTDVRRPLLWDLPGGILDPNESINDGCAREIKEETGIVVSPEQLQLAYSLNDEFEDKSVTWLLFVVKVENPQVTLSYEHDQYKWVSLEEAIEMVVYDKFNEALKYVRTYKLIP